MAAFKNWTQVDFQTSEITGTESWTEEECRTSASSTSSHPSSAPSRRWGGSPRTDISKGSPGGSVWSQQASGPLRRSRSQHRCRVVYSTEGWALERRSTRAGPLSITRTSPEFIQTVEFTNISAKKLQVFQRFIPTETVSEFYSVQN